MCSGAGDCLSSDFRPRAFVVWGSTGKGVSGWCVGRWRGRRVLSCCRGEDVWGRVGKLQYFHLNGFLVTCTCTHVCTFVQTEAYTGTKDNHNSNFSFTLNWLIIGTTIRTNLHSNLLYSWALHTSRGEQRTWEDTVSSRIYLLLKGVNFLTEYLYFCHFHFTLQACTRNHGVL